MLALLAAAGLAVPAAAAPASGQADCAGQSDQPDFGPNVHVFDPGMPSATVSNVLKPAKLETGLIVGVPHFVQEGDLIRVDSTEGKYLERVRE